MGVGRKKFTVVTYRGDIVFICHANDAGSVSVFILEGGCDCLKNDADLDEVVETEMTRMRSVESADEKVIETS